MRLCTLSGIARRQEQHDHQPKHELWKETHVLAVAIPNTEFDAASGAGLRGSWKHGWAHKGMLEKR